MQNCGILSPIDSQSYILKTPKKLLNQNMKIYIMYKDRLLTQPSVLFFK